ncbi:MAG: hypothetical protein ACR2GH_05080 [Pseudonocardia sp.]
MKGNHTMPADNPPSAPEPPYRATITASTLDDGRPRGQIVVTTTPVFSEHLAARSALPGETQYADHVDYQRIILTCPDQADVSRADLSRADATHLAAALIHAVIDSLDRGTLRHGDALTLLRAINDLLPALNRLRTQAITSARQDASAADDPPAAS